MMTALTSPADAASTPVITVGEPEGFSELASEQRFLVDVYVGDERHGDTTILATPETVRIADPAALLKLLPALSDAHVVQGMLAAADLPANSRLACVGGSDRGQCGRLSPEIVGVIFDRNRLRLDVFLNPKYLLLERNAGEGYLPALEDGLSVINAIGGALSGASGESRSVYNLQDRVLLTTGARRLRADLAFASHKGAVAEELVLEWDRPELRFSAGALWIPGNELSGRDKALGFGLESQIDTRIDKEEIAGSPLIVYLDRRARVDILRDGHLLGSAIYEAGNQQIDTSNLPDGAYEVLLQIEEPGRPSRQERRFFAKNRQLPSLGRTDFFVFGGLATNGKERGSLHPSRRPIVQGGLAHRIDENWAIEGALRATPEDATFELGATLLTPLAQVTARSIVDTDGRFGAVLQLASSGSSRFNVNVDMRHIQNSFGSALAGGGSQSDEPAHAHGSSWLGASYSQVAGVVSFSLANFRFLAVGSYRSERKQGASYSVGPSIEWDLLREGALTLSFRSDLSATDRGTAQFAGLSLRMTGSRTSLSASAGVGGSSLPDDTVGDGAIASLAGSWSTGIAGGELALGAGVDHSPRQDDVGVSSEFRHPIGSVAGELTRTNAGAATQSQYSVSGQTTIALGSGGLQVAGKTTSDSIIVARVSGAQSGDRFDVLVNDQLSGAIVGARSLALALPTYRVYQVRIRSTGDNALVYDSTARNVALYPGTVAALQWTVSRQKIKLGRLIGPASQPVPHAFITGPGIWSETDDEGRFQIEAPDDVELTVTLHDGSSFIVSLPRVAENDGIVRLGDVVCCARNPVRHALAATVETPFK